MSPTKQRVKPQQRAEQYGKPEVVRALLFMMAAKHRPTYVHLRHVSLYSTRLARTLALSDKEVNQIRVGAMLHDIGKVGLPDAILLKPGRLTDDEAAVVRNHPAHGAAILDRLGCIGGAAPLVRAHHEWYDGSGYPDGLAGDEIPVGARIIAVTDAFDTMTMPRPYRRQISIAEAVGELRRNAGTQFDPNLVDAFAELIESACITRLPWFRSGSADRRIVEPLALRFGRSRR